MNRKKEIIVDRHDLVFKAFLDKRKKSSGQAGGTTTIKLKKNGGFTLQFWERRDPLTFVEPNIELELTYSFTNVHSGFEVVHEDLYKMGYLIKPNKTGVTSASGAASRMSEDEANILVNWFDAAIEEWDDAYDRNVELAWLRDGSYDTKAPVGLDGLVNLTPTTGTIGGKSRSNPLLQHQVFTGLTTTALTGTMRLKMTQARRRANLNSRGRAGSGIDMIMAGSDFIDSYVQFAINQGIDYQTPLANGQIKKVDIGIPESGYHFENIPIVYCPTFDDLAVIEPSASVSWNKRAYMLNSKTFHFMQMEGLDKFQSHPADPSDQRVSRFSMDGRYCLAVSVPNANALVSVA
jgi:hypothetical protein